MRHMFLSQFTAIYDLIWILTTLFLSVLTVLLTSRNPMIKDMYSAAVYEI